MFSSYSSMEITDSDEIDLKTIVGIVMNNWSGLKLAIENGMGGPPKQLKIRLQSMIDHVNLTLPMAEDEDFEELGDDLYDIMNEDFSTILEDNSSYEVAREITELYQLLKYGHKEVLLARIRTFPYQMDIMKGFPNQFLPTQIIFERENGIPTNMESPNALEDEGWKLVRRK